VVGDFSRDIAHLTRTPYSRHKYFTLPFFPYTKIDKISRMGNGRERMKLDRKRERRMKPTALTTYRQDVVHFSMFAIVQPPAQFPPSGKPRMHWRGAVPGVGADRPPKASSTSRSVNSAGRSVNHRLEWCHRAGLTGPGLGDQTL
jgi:hypothetical protein